MLSQLKKEDIINHIINQVASLKMKANRGDPIIFYYSGYVGTTTVGERSAGMICPYDVVSNEGRVSDTALLQTFDELSGPVLRQQYREFCCSTGNWSLTIFIFSVCIS